MRKSDVGMLSKETMKRGRNERTRVNTRIGLTTPLGGSTSSAGGLALGLILGMSPGSSWCRSPSLECFLNSANSCATGMGGGRKDEPGDGNGVSLDDVIVIEG